LCKSLPSYVRALLAALEGVLTISYRLLCKKLNLLAQELLAELLLVLGKNSKSF
jgi:hypothetical protein